MHRKPNDNWNVEHTRYVSKPTDDSEKYVEDLVRYFGRSLEIFKEEEEEAEPQERKSASKKEKRGKSKKNIDDQPAQKAKMPLKVTSRILPQIELNLKEEESKVLRRL